MNQTFHRAHFSTISGRYQRLSRFRPLSPDNKWGGGRVAPAYSCYIQRKTHSNTMRATMNLVSITISIFNAFRSTLSFAFLTKRGVQTHFERRASWINGTSVSPHFYIYNAHNLLRSRGPRSGEARERHAPGLCNFFYSKPLLHIACPQIQCYHIMITLSSRDSFSL